MNKSTFIYIITLLVSIIASCTQHAPQEESIAVAKSPVQVVHVRNGSINDKIILSANTIYLKRNVVTAQIPAFITKVHVRLGDQVRKGAVLYELESKERRAMGQQASGIDSGLNELGMIKVYAPASGIISTLDKQQTGDYILEGTQLCTIAESNDLSFQVNVPYEYSQFAKVGSKCVITLPDNSTHDAVITTPLSAMNALAQTQPMLAKTTETLFLPENLIVKVQINKSTDGNTQVLPKPCVLSDEMMTEFWVMKLINDSTAVKVPVVIGNKNKDEVEIHQPLFNPADRIIVNGNYGLTDTASVKITQ
jgi:multidrug efflux pump subunit AcrA (membrane-fusion protein)